MMMEPDNTLFQLKGSMLTIAELQLLRNDLSALDAHLAEKVSQSPKFFQSVPLVLGLDHLNDKDNPIDLALMVNICRKHGLRPIGVRTYQPHVLRAALHLDIPILPLTSVKEKDVNLFAPVDTNLEKKAANDTKPDTLDANLSSQTSPIKPAQIVTTPIRGGQQLYAAGCDLIVLAPVSAGAEILADGHIHVYAPLRGRALAGAKGDQQARIFCQVLEAELISIAGVYKIAEDLRQLRQWGKAAHTFLKEDVLNISSL